MNMHLSTLAYHKMFPHLPADEPDPKPDKPVEQPPFDGPKKRPVQEPSDTPGKLPPYVPVEEPPQRIDEESTLVFKKHQRTKAQQSAPSRTLH